MDRRSAALCAFVRRSSSRKSLVHHAISANTVGKMLIALGYCHQVTRKAKEGSRHPDRDG
jgi:hypothetical protein